MSSARFAVASTFAFLAVVFDPTGFSPSESASAFRLLELAARFGGIEKDVMCVANKEERGREYDAMTKLRKSDITCLITCTVRVNPFNHPVRNDGDGEGVNHSPRNRTYTSLERG